MKFKVFVFVQSELSYLTIYEIREVDGKSPRSVAIKVFVFDYIRNSKSLIKNSPKFVAIKSFEFDYLQNSKS